MKKFDFEIDKAEILWYAIKAKFNTEAYRSGDVCERCRWQIQRAIRSGSGRNFVSDCERKISGTATGHNEAVLKIWLFRFCIRLQFNSSLAKFSPNFRSDFAKIMHGGISKRSQRGCLETFPSTVQFDASKPCGIRLFQFCI